MLTKGCPAELPRRLTGLLLAEKRIDDAKKAFADAAYRKKLFREYGIEVPSKTKES